MKKTLVAIATLAFSMSLVPDALAACKNCGTITDVREVKKEGEGSGAGAVVGGVLGGVLGHQIGSGRGNTAATVVGAGAGAYAGHQVEKNQKTTTSYQVVIKMDQGKDRVFNFKDRPSWRVGDEVEIVDGKMTRPKK